MKKRVEHELKSIALARAKCSCGWTYKVEKLKGKTDEDLAIETGTAFTSHKKSKEK